MGEAKVDSGWCEVGVKRLKKGCNVLHFPPLRDDYCSKFLAGMFSVNINNHSDVFLQFTLLLMVHFECSFFCPLAKNGTVAIGYYYKLIPVSGFNNTTLRCKDQYGKVICWCPGRVCEWAERAMFKWVSGVAYFFSLKRLDFGLDKLIEVKWSIWTC
ncbi:hypothetical protein CTI12_AA353570 [Artemisia annua]|uniref:Uncharacterized protein n=1 Tax=Artemisia annua TaxID=35608 RepID=A0A2U1MQI0_ARTAN|nr:hypothetical protein CTI12_AA353570 [Artemisia annua]